MIGHSVNMLIRISYCKKSVSYEPEQISELQTFWFGQSGDTIVIDFTIFRLPVILQKKIALCYGYQTQT